MATLRALNNIVYGRTTAPTSGAAVILMSSSILTETITIKALDTNTGQVYVGNSVVTSGSGYPLYAGETVTLDIDHFQANVYIVVDNGGEGVAYLGGRLE
jgi:hypothetical protein